MQNLDDHCIANIHSTSKLLPKQPLCVAENIGERSTNHWNGLPSDIQHKTYHCEYKFACRLFWILVIILKRPYS